MQEARSPMNSWPIRPSVHPPDEAPAGLSLSSQRVRLMLITSTQRSVPRSCWVVFFSTQSAWSLPRDLRENPFPFPKRLRCRWPVSETMLVLELFEHPDAPVLPAGPARPDPGQVVWSAGRRRGSSPHCGDWTHYAPKGTENHTGSPVQITLPAPAEGGAPSRWWGGSKICPRPAGLCWQAPPHSSDLGRGGLRVRSPFPVGSRDLWSRCLTSALVRVVVHHDEGRALAPRAHTLRSCDPVVLEIW